MRTTPFSSSIRPQIAGARGAIAAAHPLATAAGQEILAVGGNAADATVAAQAALCVITPEACGLGGDGFFLVAPADGPVAAVNAAGPSPAAATAPAANGGASVTVPGLVDGWHYLSARFGRLDLARCLAPAIRLARTGVVAEPGTTAAVAAQRRRLVAGGADEWVVLHARTGERIEQFELGNALDMIAKDGRAAYYGGPIGRWVAAAAERTGGALAESDLAAGAATIERPIAVAFGGRTVHVQPPMSQGVLLAMALAARAALGAVPPERAGHALVELAEAAFAHRGDVAAGEALLSRPLEISLDRAARRAGARAYLHTAAVSVADAEGMTVASLASVFDDFGSGVLVPEAGFVLNNRCGGFTDGANAFAAGKRPVHTLAPVIVTGVGETVGFATPGADGQVQTLLQVLSAWLLDGTPLAEAVDARRWRAEEGRVLVEAGHAGCGALARLGHVVADGPAGDMRFGALAVAGNAAGTPFALADWRRTTWAGVA